MCRILVLSGRDKSIYASVFSGFVEASKHDIYLKMLGRTHTSHSDGWGIVAVGLANSKPVVMKHKSLIPIYDDISKRVLELFENRLTRYDEAFLLLHSRLSSRKEPYGEEYTHPYEYTGHNIASWFIHNGGIDKYELARILELNPHLYTDSWTASIYISRLVDECVGEGIDIDRCVVEAYRELLKHTVSALNTGLLVLYNDGVYLYSTHYVCKDYLERAGRKEELERYYQLYKSISTETVLVASSTQKHYMRNWNMKPVEPGIYRLEPGEIIKLDAF